MDKNLTAILREGARTVNVTFQGYNNPYTYVTFLADLKPGDFLVVPHLDKQNKERLSIAVVAEVHDTVEIRPNDEIEYRWVVGKVDMDGYNKLLADNKTLEDELTKVYQAQMRKSARERFLGDLDDEGRARLLPLLSQRTIEG